MKVNIQSDLSLQKPLTNISVIFMTKTTEQIKVITPGHLWSDVVIATDKKKKDMNRYFDLQRLDYYCLMELDDMCH